jgi:hypothetical protein
VPVIRFSDAVHDAFDGNAAAPMHDTRIAEMLQSAVAVVVPHRIGVAVVVATVPPCAVGVAVSKTPTL